MSASIEPQSFGPYTLLRSLGKGGMAEVFLARAGGSGGYPRLLAIKRLLGPFTASEQLVSMMADEARLSVWLNHPNIVQVLDFGKVGKSYFIAMEYVDGCDLCRLVRVKGRKQGRPLPLPTALYALHQVAEALDYAHRRTNSEGNPLGIVHRDVSPHNVLISREGQVKLADFGLARTSISVHESHAGVIRGKFAYMPKEQANGRDIDHRIDIFAAGATLYEALTGVRPYSASNLAEQLYQLEQQVPLPSAHIADIPPEIDDLTMQALSPEPETRYQTAEELANDLRHALAKLSTPTQEAQQLAALVKSTVGPSVIAEKMLRPTLGELPVEQSLIGDAIAEVQKDAERKRKRLHVVGSALNAPPPPTDPEDHDTWESKGELPPPAQLAGDDSESSVPTVAKRLANGAGDSLKEAVRAWTGEEEVPSGDNVLPAVHGSIAGAGKAPATDPEKRSARRRKEPKPARPPRTAPVGRERPLQQSEEDDLDDAKTIQRTPETAKASIDRALSRRRKRPPTDQVTRPGLAQRKWEVIGVTVGLFLLGGVAGWLLRGAGPPCPPPRPCPAAGSGIAPQASPIMDAGALPDVGTAPAVQIVDARAAAPADARAQEPARGTRPRISSRGRRPATKSRRRRPSEGSDESGGAGLPAGKDGTLTISAGEEAMVFVEGQLVGPAPLENMPIPPGTYKLKVLFTADKSYSGVRSITVKSGKAMSIHFKR